MVSYENNGLEKRAYKAHEVCVTSCADYDEEHVISALKTCMEHLHGLDWVKPGMHIALKVNLVSGMSPELAATTHPVVIKVLAQMLAEQGASVTIGDSPGGLYTKAHVTNVYRACGLEDIQCEKIHLNMDFSTRDTVFNDARSIRTFTYTSWLDHADAIINISKFKTHAMMAMSASVKNMFGTIPGITKPEYHMRFPNIMAFADLMVDLNEYFKPVLCIVDAIDGMEGNGPTAGNVRHVGALIAGRSPYDTDMVCANIMGLNRHDVPTIEAAYLRGIGPEDLSQVKITGDLNGYVMKDYKLASHSQSITFSDDRTMGKLRSGLMKWLLATKPVLSSKECVGCAKCSMICPAKAITMIHKKPKIDRDKCIHCFCCQEFCPKGAMKVHHHPLGNLIHMVDSGK